MRLTKKSIDFEVSLLLYYGILYSNYANLVVIRRSNPPDSVL